MNLLLLTSDDLDPARPPRDGVEHFRVGGARAAHVREVLGAERGARVRVGLLEGPVGHASVVDDDGDALTLAWPSADRAPEPPRPGVTVVLAVPRPKTLQKLLPDLATFGVERVILLRTWKVDRAYLTSEVLRPERVRASFHAGLMQGRRTTPPALELAPLFRPWVEDLAPGLVAEHDLAWLADPDAAIGVAALAAQVGRARRVLVAIGPEGGFTAFEREALVTAGFVEAALGRDVLRVETAVVAALAQLGLLRALAAP
jgi:16S rRNA (uracil1498-N3)-methyltransferase